MLIYVYILIALLCLLYVKFETRKKSTDVIVVLSGKNEYITSFRLKTAIRIYQDGDTVVTCGKELATFMKSELEKADVKNVKLQNKSTNTYEDAKHFMEMFPKIANKKFILVTSLSHQRRAYHTFLHFFDKNMIINQPAWGELFSSYSPLIPTGWFAALLNLYNDFKYNKRI